MAAELVLTPESEQDLADGYEWYEACRTGLGEEFLSCVDAAMQIIRRQPNSFAIMRDQYRRVLVRRFPYQVIYESLETKVIIYGVFHTSRDSQSWLDRLK